MAMDADSVAVLQKLQKHSSDVTSVDFGPNFQLAAGSSDKTVMLYEWRQGLGFVESSFCPLRGHKYGVTCVRFCPTLPLLASASTDGHTNLWSLKNGECVQSVVQASGNGVRTITFSSDGILLATAGEGGMFCLWSLAFPNYNLVRVVTEHDDESVQGVSFSPDNMLLASGDVTGTYKVWSIPGLKNGDQMSSLLTVRDAHDLGVNYLEFSPEHTVHLCEEDGVTERTYLLASCGNDELVCLWQVTVFQGGKGSDAPFLPSSPPPHIVTRLSGHTSAVSQGRISSRGDFLASSSIDNTTRIWQIASGRCLKTLEGHTRYVTSCAFSPDQSLLATGSNDRSLIVWDLTGDFNLDSQMTSSPSYQELIAERMVNEKDEDKRGVVLLTKIADHSSSVNSVSFNSNHLVSAGSDHKIVIYKWSGLSLSRNHVIKKAHRYSINQVDLSSTSELFVSCSLDGNAVLWNAESGEVKKSGWHVSGSGVRCVRFSPDSRLIAAGGDDDVVRVYRADLCEKLVSIKEDGEGVTSLSLSFDSEVMIVGAADGHVRIYRIAPPSSTPVGIIENANDLGVSSVDFSPVAHNQLPGEEDRYEIATCGFDCLVKVWHFKATDFSPNLLWTLAGHGGNVTCVRYSPHLAEMIASTSTDKSCRLWDSYSGYCLHVVESQESVLTCCSFSPDSTLLAVGSMDKSVSIWRLPTDLAFRSFVAHRKNNGKTIVESWTVEHVNRWLESYNLPPSNFTGLSILRSPIDDILNQLNIDEEQREEVKKRLLELRKDKNDADLPDEFVCPITHQLMRDPVLASDGVSYERSAIESWFSTGRLSSPMTNAVLDSIKIEPNVDLRRKICDYLGA